MFGDPAISPKRWKEGSLVNYGTFKNGLNFRKGEFGATIRYLGVGDFKARSKIGDVKSLSKISLNSDPAENYLLNNGDIVFVRSNGNQALVGRCLSVYPDDEKVTYSGFCIRYRIDRDSISPDYLTSLFRTSSMRAMMLQGGQGANIQNINQQMLSSLKIPIPPSHLQAEFDATIEKHEALMSKNRKSLADTDSLFGSLCQKSFSGDI